MTELEPLSISWSVCLMNTLTAFGARDELIANEKVLNEISTWIASNRNIYVGKYGQALASWPNALPTGALRRHLNRIDIIVYDELDLTYLKVTYPDFFSSCERIS